MTARDLTGDAVLSRTEIMATLDHLCARMDWIEAQCTEGFPLYSPGTDNAWTVSQGGSWVGGYWAACWWLRAHLRRVESDRQKARLLCRRLAAKMDTDSIHRAMLFWYGAALGARWCGDEAAGRVAQAAADVLAGAFDRTLQCIPTGTAIGGGSHGRRHIAIDALGPLIELLTHSDNQAHHDIARRHTDTVLAACLNGDGAFHAEALYADQAGPACPACHPIGQAGAWSRGQAWGMFGLAAAARWGEPYRAQARAACEYWLRSRPCGIPPDRLDQPSGLADPSAALIAALAMQLLAKVEAAETPWQACAERQIAAVVRSRYLTGAHNAEGGTPPGIFWGACYQTRPGQRELVEAAWSSFLLMQALSTLAGAPGAASRID
ncbi:glucuronyl hydrolase [Duganella sp. FT3S]|uniref:Glucuronyl hydrolase n=1 Tax=Rugamonas fusca TaxID=2758568 RepID=A0A7W2I5C0_9BURK|nr:glucuronyl hydrolase [Rugamonas fusca]MBA5604234.1 glucuronyl hydrolase [Rugamonas fusca]